jgi:ParB family transcriptional regulator, chromosome partitioning protein
LGKADVNKRRDALKAMMTPITALASEDQLPRTQVQTGALRAIGLSLEGLSKEADEAKALREQLATGAQVVELNPELIDPSFIRDRLDESRAAVEELRASIAEHGQQVPILVRPSSERVGRYQVAYGHRRVDALKQIGRPVKAIVKHLSDEELVVAQGKENLERRDLSYIERALFAARLEDHGIGRVALMAALSMHKGNLSTMISAARAVPEELIIAIGPAPRVGRPRWEQLTELLRHSGESWRNVVAASDFETLDSDARFGRILRAVSPAQKTQTFQLITDSDGRGLARMERGSDRMRLTIEEHSVPAFGAYLVERLPEIYAAFRRQSEV